MTEHFSLNEFACHDGTPVPPEYLDRVERLAEQLEVLRAELGGAPVKIMSGYRTPEHNRKVGGARASQHVQARAADIKVHGYTPREVYETILRLIREGRMMPGGLGRYPTFVHYDIRGRNARWRPKKL